MKKSVVIIIVLLFCSPAVIYGFSMSSAVTGLPSFEISEVWGDTPGADHPGVSEDTFVAGGFWRKNSLSDDPYLVSFSMPSNPVFSRIFMKWDLSAIPPGATITGASLYLFYDYELIFGDGEDYNVYAAKVETANPDISKANWETFDGINPWTGGADGGAGDLAGYESVSKIGSEYGYYEWDVTGMVRDWVSGRSPNYGMALSGDESVTMTDFRFFLSGDHPDPENRPKLVITYAVSPRSELWSETADADHSGVCKDTYIENGYNSDLNFSSSPLLKTYTWPSYNSVMRILMKWDLSAIPASAIILDARLSLYYASEEADGGDDSYDVPVAKVIHVDPLVSEATWNSYDGFNEWTGGSDGGSSDLAAPEESVAIERTHGFYEWDVTEMVRDWVSGRYPNFGMALSGDENALSFSNRFFSSCEEPDATKRPKLSITYITDQDPGYETFKSQSATLSWEEPATNEDGTPLTDLAGFRVYYGTSPLNYTGSVDVGNVKKTTIFDLSPGTWYFSVTAYDLSGNESVYSNEVSKSIH